MTDGDQTGKVHRAREWLDRNRVFFETVAATLLGAMAVIVSVVQIAQTSAQTQLAEIELAVAKQQALPQFIVRATQEKRDDPDRYTEDVLIVDNEGGLARGVESNTAVFLDITATPERGGQARALTIPVNGYYWATGHTPAGRGRVLTITSHKNWLRVHDLEVSLRKRAADEGYYVDLGVRRFLRLSYQDAFGKSATDYFFVPLIYGGTLIAQTDGEAAFEEYARRLQPGGIMMDIDELDANAVWSLLVR